ncbi:hypothetical protein BKP45_20495 [Anaerobacillus alkalidiazotrophicus]|uniref:AB hydrolase-1 domain-containing protein n=1 Tax=Anaerobacillus alkalidiazotrophicus TaxID=472963 RepID=A0A1S2M1Y1_9BACI|nr:alpha/beta hydrolase [Anaerobacillus alkalidiazotrophicus]OIJ17937.1 hypothetical protein BKP45_20495 [Anaerobacillus alkalidiazotrophicus]
MKPHIIMLSGWATDKEVFRPLQTELQKTYQVSCIDWRKIERLTDYKNRLLEKIMYINGPIVLLGWSLGSIVAIEVASILSERLKGLICIGGTSSFTMKSDYLSGWKPRIVNLMKKKLVMDKDQTLFTFYQTFFSCNEKNKGFDKKFLQLVHDKLKGDQLSSIMMGLTYLIETDVRMHLKNINIPTMLIHGKNDSICPFEASQFIYEQMIENARLYVLEDAGHIPFFTNEDLCLKWINSFLESEIQYD